MRSPPTCLPPLLTYKCCNMPVSEAESKIRGSTSISGIQVANTGFWKSKKISFLPWICRYMILLGRADLELVFHTSTHHPQGIVHCLSGHWWHLTYSQGPQRLGVETRSYLISHPATPLLHFLLLLHGPHMSQFTHLNVHIWVGSHFQHTETTYLMVIIPEVPNVISGTEIIGFFFSFRKWLRGQEYTLHFSWLSLILHIYIYIYRKEI